jgi:hypothetical protein
MPSKARKTFDESARDIEHLLEAWEAAGSKTSEVNSSTTDVLLRSAVVLLVSYWEAYVEDICSEALEHIVLHSKDASKIPMEAKKVIATELKKAPHDLEVWKLADSGWRNYLKERLPRLKSDRDRSWNSPKADATSKFISDVVGLEDIHKAWDVQKLESKAAAEKLDALIKSRGQIAHRGKLEQPLTQEFVTDYANFLSAIVSKTGGSINRHVIRITGKPLWQANLEAVKKAGKRVSKRRRQAKATLSDPI